MFKELKNEAILTFTLKNEGPLLINSGGSTKIKPRPDMSFVRTTRNGKETIYLPGSSIKGVFRSRYEQLMRAMGQSFCDTFDAEGNQTCNKKIKEEKKVGGTERYKMCCEACKLFGSLALGGRISFADAYPVGEPKLGMRHGVGIDRITGGAFPKALYDIETLEDGKFEVKCKITSFEPYQLRAVLWVLDDIDDGLVTFGMGGSRGNGQMSVDGKVRLVCREYSKEGLNGFYTKTEFESMTEIKEYLQVETKEDFDKAIRKLEEKLEQKLTELEAETKKKAVR